ncbi:MAG: photosystem II stability/assembly factor-like uncharacterized protein [Litorivivens sp.]|jgi:photosystem II stability/assembly factor-like uncharacterized protein
MRRCSFLVVLIAVALSCLCSNEMMSQNWVKLRQSGATPSEVKAEFNTEWSNREYVRGNGYKQHERWNYFWHNRTEHGGLANANSQEFLSLLTARSNSSNNRAAGNWEPMGLSSWDSNSYGPGNGRINIIAIDPNNDENIYVGTPSGGIWKSTDAGSSWTPIGDQLSVLGVSGIVISHEDSNVIYIGTGDRDGNDTYSLGVFKSIDGGDSWQTAGLTWPLSNTVKTNKMLMHPLNAETVFTATSDGLFRTLNGGISWTEILSGNVQDIEFNSGDSDIIYAGKDRIYVSIDGGDNFNPVTNGLPSPSTVGRICLAVTPADPAILYAMYADDDSYAYQGLYRSIDMGENWQLQSDSPNLMTSDANGSALWGQAWYDMELTVSDTDVDRIIVGGVNLWESSDAGENWELNSYWTYPADAGLNYVHADIHHLSFNDGILWCGTDGGIFRSINSGNTFSDLSDGLEISQFYRFSSYAGNSDLVIGGTQDNGTNLRESGSWTHVLGADGMEAIIHPSDPSIMFACTQYGDIHKSTDGGQSFDWSASGISEDGPWVTPYIMSPVNSNVMYAGFGNVWRSSDQGDSWSQISDFDNQEMQALAMGAAQPNTIYAATNSNFYKTTNGGNDWVSIESGLPNETVSFLAVDPVNADRIWCTYSGFDENEKVFYSSDGGETWENLSANLPNCPVNCIVYDKETEKGVYIGTDLGVFYTDETLANWEIFGDGLPNVIVSELEINYSESKLLAATFGRGIWRSDMWSNPTNAPVAMASASPQFVCEGGSISFTDMSSLNTPEWSWTFPGGTPSISTEQHPEVLYESPGYYDYSLEVSNSAGVSTWDCEGCIHVYPNEGSQQPFVEGFETTEDFNGSDWHIGNVGPITWELTGGASHFGSKCVMLNNYAIDNEEIHTLTYHPIDLTTVEDGETLYLTYWYSFANISGDNSDRFRVYMSTDCGESYTLKQQINTLQLPTSEASDSPFYPQEADNWSFEVYAFEPSEITSSVSVQFWFRTGNGNNLFIDDINISQNINGSITPVAMNGLTVYPNPSSESIQIEGLDGLANYPENWRIYNLLGKSIMSGRTDIHSKKLQIDISQLSSGAYTLNFSEEMVQIKFVVE